MSTEPTNSPPSTAMPPSAVCLGCRYALRGLPEPRCPECGREFDPENPFSYRVPRTERTWVDLFREWAMPPRPAEIWLTCGGAAVAALRILLSLAGPEPRIPIDAIAVPVFIPTALFIIRYTLAAIALTILPRYEGMRRKIGMEWLLGPIFLLLPFLPLLANDALGDLWSFRVRASLGDLEAKAKSMRARPHVEGACWIGYIRFRRIAVLNDGRVKFEYAPGAAIVYAPDVSPDESTEASDGISGPWQHMSWGN